MTRVVGIDPGKTGAVSLIDTDEWTLAVFDMPCEPGTRGKDAVSPVGVVRLLQNVRPDYSFIEDVWSSPLMGVASSFSFGRSLGIVLGACASDSVLTMVKPTEWKARTGTPKDKNEARRRAQQLFPCAFELFNRVKDDGRAESAILAFFGLLTLRMSPPRPLALQRFTAGTV